MFSALAFGTLLFSAPAHADTYRSEFGGDTHYYYDFDYTQYSVFYVRVAGTLESAGLDAYSSSPRLTFGSIGVWNASTSAWETACYDDNTYSSVDYYPYDCTADVHLDGGDYVLVTGRGSDGVRWGYDADAPVPVPEWGLAVTSGKVSGDITYTPPSSPPSSSGRSDYGALVVFTADDADGDGFDTTVDCDDRNAARQPGASEVWYDGIDGDCLGGSDYDQDGDGEDSDAYGGEDCDDLDASIHPGARDTWYDGEDTNCDGHSDYDQDGDGDDSSDYGGGDCDDTDPAINSHATETWYDGIDSDCSGGSDYDKDGDGLDVARFGGDDCDDEDASVKRCDGGGDTGTGDDGGGGIFGKKDGDGGGCGSSGSGGLCCTGGNLAGILMIFSILRPRRVL